MGLSHSKWSKIKSGARLIIIVTLVWAHPGLQMLSASEEKEQKVTVPACTPKSPFFRLRHMLSASD